MAVVVLSSWNSISDTPMFLPLLLHHARSRRRDTQGRGPLRSFLPRRRSRCCSDGRGNARSRSSSRARRRGESRGSRLVLLDHLFLLAVLVLLHIERHNERLAMQFRRVVRTRHSHCLADRAKFALRDVHGGLIGVPEVEANPVLAPLAGAVN